MVHVYYGLKNGKAKPAHHSKLATIGLSSNENPTIFFFKKHLKEAVSIYILTGLFFWEGTVFLWDRFLTNLLQGNPLSLQRLVIYSIKAYAVA